jgi:ankyrin repeat protein
MAVPTPVMNTPPAVINPPAAGKIPKAISPHNLPQKQTIQSNHIEEEIIQEIMNDTSFIMRKPYQNKITLPIQNKNVLSPMMLFDSVKKDSINELYALLQQGIDINIQNNKNGQTAVMFASKYNKIKTLRFLIEHGADLSIVDVNGRTALHLAAMNNNVDAMIVLINSDIDPLIKDNEGRRASDYIKDNRVVLLMAANYKDMNKALIDFVSLSSISGVEYALNHGANINIQDDIGQEGDTPLMIAVKLNNLNMISMLLNHGADLYAKNKLKQTVFDIVKNNTGIANILKTVQITRDLSK